MPKPKPITLNELAARITAHLKKFEADPKINKGQRYDRDAGVWVEDPKGTRDYYMANAYNNGRRVAVVYISYQGSSKLTRDEATAYLAWLDAGNVGKHFAMERAANTSSEAREFMARFENKKRGRR